MRKFVTVLMMVLMLSTSARYAAAEGDGGGIVNLNTVSAFSKPVNFLTVVIIEVAILLVLYQPQFTIPRAARFTTVGLILSGTQTLLFFQQVLQALQFYLVYKTFERALLHHGTSNVSSTGKEAEEVKKPPVFNYLAFKKELEAEKNRIAMEKVIDEMVADVKKQTAIDKAVKEAMRNPETAKNYLIFATPAMRAALNRALKNQAAAAHGAQ